jgi:hypothetical protein
MMAIFEMNFEMNFEMKFEKKNPMAEDCFTFIDPAPAAAFESPMGDVTSASGKPRVPGEIKFLAD